MRVGTCIVATRGTVPLSVFPSKLLTNMSALNVLLQAAEFIERRERGQWLERGPPSPLSTHQLFLTAVVVLCCRSRAWLRVDRADPRRPQERFEEAKEQEISGQ